MDDIHPSNRVARARGLPVARRLFPELYDDDCLDMNDESLNDAHDCHDSDESTLVDSAEPFRNRNHHAHSWVPVSLKLTCWMFMIYTVYLFSVYILLVIMHTTTRLFNDGLRNGTRSMPLP